MNPEDTPLARFLNKCKEQSIRTRQKNIDKHLRIANACKSEEERAIHLAKAEKLQSKYDSKAYQPPFETLS